jgi:hypothetical protein
MRRRGDPMQYAGSSLLSLSLSSSFTQFGMTHVAGDLRARATPLS